MSQKYELTDGEEGNYPISSMCRWSKVSRSGYYSWRDRPQSDRDIRRQELVSMIETEFNASDGTYGYRRITARLGRRGVSVHRDTVRCLMRRAGLVAAQPRRKVRTTIPAADLASRPDLMRRDSRRPGAGSQVGGGHHLYPHLGRICLPGHCSGLRHKESRGVCDGRSYAHLTGVRCYRYGRAQLPRRRG